MLSWRITKYNPRYRDQRGAYLKDEWICYSDIGKSFDDKLLTLEEYIETENAYIEALILFMQYLKVPYFTLTSVEKHTFNMNDARPSSNMIHIFKSVKEGIPIGRSTVNDYVRLILRNVLWGKLEAHDMFVHFGYDYYMYIGATHQCFKTIQKIKHMGLFVEEFESPYHD